MSGPSYKLYYFNIKALAEPIRYILAYGGIEYEDVRVERADWPALKPSKFNLCSIHIDMMLLALHLNANGFNNVSFF